MRLLEKKKYAYDEVVKTLLNSQGSKAQALCSLLSNKLKFVYQHLGSKITNLPNANGETFVSLLISNDAIINLKRVEDIPVKHVNVLVNEEEFQTGNLTERSNGSNQSLQGYFFHGIPASKLWFTVREYTDTYGDDALSITKTPFLRM